MADDTVKTDADSAAEERLFSCWITKEGHFFRTWRKRWMIFDGNARQISYYKTKEASDAKEQPKGMDTVGDCTIAMYRDIETLVLTCRGGKMYNIRFEQRSDMLRANAVFGNRMHASFLDGDVSADGDMATRIQAMYRGRQARGKMKLTKAEMDVRAVVLAQRAARGLLARTRRAKLDMEMVRPMRLLIKSAELLPPGEAGEAKLKAAEEALAASGGRRASVENRPSIPNDGAKIGAYVALVYHPSPEADTNQRFCFELPAVPAHGGHAVFDEHILVPGMPQKGTLLVVTLVNKSAKNSFLGQVIFKLDDDHKCWRDGCDLKHKLHSLHHHPLSKPESEGRSPYPISNMEAAGYGTVSVQLLPRDNAKTQCGFLGYREMAKGALSTAARSAVSNTADAADSALSTAHQAATQVAGGDSAKAKRSSIFKSSTSKAWGRTWLTLTPDGLFFYKSWWGIEEPMLMLHPNEIKAVTVFNSTPGQAENDAEEFEVHTESTIHQFRIDRTMGSLKSHRKDRDAWQSKLKTLAQAQRNGAFPEKLSVLIQRTRGFEKLVGSSKPFFQVTLGREKRKSILVTSPSGASPPRADSPGGNGGGDEEGSNATSAAAVAPASPTSPGTPATPAAAATPATPATPVTPAADASEELQHDTMEAIELPLVSKNLHQRRLVVKVKSKRAVLGQVMILIDELNPNEATAGWFSTFDPKTGALCGDVYLVFNFVFPEGSRPVALSAVEEVDAATGSAEATPTTD